MALSPEEKLYFEIRGLSVTFFKMLKNKTFESVFYISSNITKGILYLCLLMFYFNTSYLWFYFRHSHEYWLLMYPFNLYHDRNCPIFTICITSPVLNVCASLVVREHSAHIILSLSFFMTLLLKNCVNVCLGYSSARLIDPTSL